MSLALIIFIAAAVFFAVLAIVAQPKPLKPRYGILVIFLGVAMVLGGFSGFMRVMGKPDGNLNLSMDLVICGLAVAGVGLYLAISSAAKK
jgi:hypothetical protein